VNEFAVDVGIDARNSVQKTLNLVFRHFYNDKQ